MSYIIFEPLFVAMAGCCMILITLRSWGYADSRMTRGIAQCGLTPEWDTDRTSPGEGHEGSPDSSWPSVSAGYPPRPRSFLLVILVPARKHHERRDVPTPVGRLWYGVSTSAGSRRSFPVSPYNLSYQLAHLNGQSLRPHQRGKAIGFLDCGSDSGIQVCRFGTHLADTCFDGGNAGGIQVKAQVA